MALTNPGNTVRLHSRNAGRASVYEANMWAQKFTNGLYSGNGILQNTPSANMGVKVGGTTASPDVVIASNPSGFKIALDLVSQQTITITTPASNSRIASIVAYCDDLSINSSDTTTTGNQSSCGLLIVYGSTSATPTAPSDSTIRSAITTDGATGSQACYVVIGNITTASTTTTITQTMIDAGKLASQMAGSNLVDSSVGLSKLDPSLGSVWQLLADVTLTGAAAQNLTTPAFTPMRFMEIEVNGVVAATGQMISLQFNNDAGISSYSRYALVNGTAQSADTSGILIGSPASNGVEFSAWFKMAYRSSAVQPNGSYMSFILGGDQRMGSFVWKNASAALTTARLNCAAGNGLGVGTRLVIRGHN